MTGIIPVHATYTGGDSDGLSEYQATEGIKLGGDPSNYIDISSTGELTLVGTAKIERHIQVPLSVIATSGTTDYIYASIIPCKIMNQNVDVFYFQQELFSDWDGSNVYVELDWLNRTDLTNGQTVILIFSWKALAEGEDADSGSLATDTVTYTAVGTVSAGTFIHSRVTLPNSSGNQPLTADDHIFMSVYRDATADTYGGDVLATAFEFIYVSKSFPVG